MTFQVGETVVYPHHGAALIEAMETRVVKGEERLYLVLKVAQGDLTVRVPADNAEYVGVRDVGGTRARAASVPAAADVVDHDLRAQLGHVQSVLATDPVA